MNKRSHEKGIRVLLLLAALYFIYGIAIPFIMSDEFEPIGLCLIGL